MAVIRPITDTEYASWLAESVPAYASDKVASGAWSADEALEKSVREHETLLPAGRDTNDNYLYSVLDETGLRVGTLWFAAKEQGQRRIAYVYNVEIDAQHRRRGHAMRAFEELEGEVRSLGFAGIALHVFGHNLAARALYMKLGYQPTHINMYKPVDGAAG